MRLPISINWKGETYNLILVNLNQLIKMVYYKLVTVIIDIHSLAKMIFNVIV